MQFTRITIDVDRAGHTIGASYEHRLDDSVDLVHVMTQPGPFETPQEAFQRTYDHVVDRYGWHVPLFD